MIEQIEELNGQINVSGNVVGTIIGQNCSGGGGSGGGDMYKSVYDRNDNGIVDNAEKVNNHTVLSDVPANAVFTDTTYTAGTGIDITGGVISNTQTSAEWGNISGNLSDQTDLKTALDSKANSSSIPTKISDLTNDSNFIETSQTSGLIKNDGTIDTTSYSTFSGNYNDLSNKPTIPTNTSDLTNDSEFKSVGIGDNHGSATEDIYFEKRYDYHRYDVGLNNNLNGTSLVFSWEEVGYETTFMETDNVTYPYNTDNIIFESSNYAITFWHGMGTGIGYYEEVYFKDKSDSSNSVLLYQAYTSGDYGEVEVSYDNFTLPDDFGTVTTVDTNIGVYPFIKKEVYIYSHSDTYVKDGLSFKKVNNEEVRIQEYRPDFGKLWINPNDTLNSVGTEVVNSLNGDEETKSPSVKAIKNALQDIYSTSEIKTNKVWIDGKPIYRKVVEKNITLAVGDNTFAHNISNISEVTSVSYTFEPSWDSTMRGTEAYLAKNGIGARIYTNSITIESDSLTWTGIFRFVIEYTKTTD